MLLSTLMLVCATPVHPQESALPPKALVWEIKNAPAEAAGTQDIFAQPESAYFDPGSGLIYVSNVAGDPGGKDGKGWITALDANGLAVKTRWVEGLNAPKGLRSHKGRLYAADIDVVVEMDVAKASILRRIACPGAKMLNDVAVDGNGTLYVSDTLSSRIYRIPPGADPEVFLEGPQLESPNGLYVRGRELLVAAWGLAAPDWSTKTPGRLLSIDLKTKSIKPLTETLGHLDGLEADGKRLWVSDWSAGTVYRVESGGKAAALARGFKNSADIGWVPRKHLLIVPRMGENAVSAYDARRL